jgi:hypothetical protein
MNDDTSTLEGLKATVNQAIVARDVRAESVARVNLACAYLQMELPEARGAFDEAMTAVRRAQNPRSEGILSMAFAPWFVDHGDPARALELAQRGEELTRTGRLGHRALSHIQLARVLYQGFADTEQAGAAVDKVVAELSDEQIENPTDRTVVIAAAGQAALAAVQAGDAQRALALMRIIDPQAASKLAQQNARPVAKKLTAAQREELTRLYTQWGARLSSRKPADARVIEMARKARDMLNWNDARARDDGAGGNSGAVCDFVDLIQSVAAGARSIEEAAAEDAELWDDDLVFVVMLATDPRFNGLLPGWAVFELAGENASDSALAGRALRLAAAIGADQRDPRTILSLLERADKRLDGGVDDALHAEVANEIAVCHLNLRQPQPALQAAYRAANYAALSRAEAIGRMARGNLANAMLQLQLIAEALTVFEVLERDQIAARENDMAAVTRQNIEACRAYLAKNRGR